MSVPREVVLRQVSRLSPDVVALTLECADGAPLHYVPGQWLNLHVAVSGSLETRAYSIASAPDAQHPERFEIAVTRVGEGLVSLCLHELAVGSKLTVDGPHGFFTREGHGDAPALFVGTGTGLAPLRAMLHTSLRTADGAPLVLLFGSRTEADILYRDELRRLAQTSERFRYEVTLSQPASTWSGRRGYVQSHLAQLIDPANKPHVYVCGLSRMVAEVRQVLKDELGFDRKLIHSERYD